ncbi:uncharacterized protein LOC114711525 [Neltuma alba]|uniref:uncharacterized protein LOC114711525 n=1 Tax=Neltuma alba TaxID=207710 RepID=UPI0010A4478E|nr:uncharacterized protein LOC114711525 [Prosopis alba]
MLHNYKTAPHMQTEKVTGGSVEVVAGAGGKSWEGPRTWEHERAKQQLNDGSEVMKINEFRSWVILWEGAVLLFSCGGKFVTNGEGEVRYNGGGVRLRSIKDGLTLDELRLMISEWIGGDGRNYDIKYTVAFDEKTLIDLHDNAEMYNLFQYNGNSGHVYVAEKRQVGPQPRDNVEITERFMGMSQQTELDASPISLCCDYGWLSEENARECDNDEISGPPNVDKSIGAEDTDGSEMFALANKFVAKYMRNSKEFMSIRCKVEVVHGSYVQIMWGRVVMCYE